MLELLCTSTIVSIHAPWEGCDVGGRYLDIVTRKFQFTHPGKGATMATLYDIRERAVSIHAPWEGCDSTTRDSPSSKSCFNSRTLGRVRLRLLPGAQTAVVVSIHAPWEGCDRNPFSPFFAPLLFQFTHPGKGATSPSTLALLMMRSFNSRTLGRVRQLVVVLRLGDA